MINESWEWSSSSSNWFFLSFDLKNLGLGTISCRQPTLGRCLPRYCTRDAHSPFIKGALLSFQSFVHPLLHQNFVHLLSHDVQDLERGNCRFSNRTSFLQHIRIFWIQDWEGYTVFRSYSAKVSLENFLQRAPLQRFLCTFSCPNRQMQVLSLKNIPGYLAGITSASAVELPFHESFETCFFFQVHSFTEIACLINHIISLTAFADNNGIWLIAEKTE